MPRSAAASRLPKVSCVCPCVCWSVSVCVSLCMCARTCAMQASAHGGQKRTSAPLGVKLKAVVEPPNLSAGDRIRVLYQNGPHSQPPSHFSSRRSCSLPQWTMMSLKDVTL